MLKKIALFALISSLHGLPTHPLIVEGEVDFSGDAASLKITATDRSIIEWRDFSIDAGESAHFFLPQDTSVILNRVTGHAQSRIWGELASNGKVLLINPHGVLFGPHSRVDVASFIASTLDLHNDLFLQGKELHFVTDGTASIAQEGKITCRLGDLILLASHIETKGTLEAINGAVECLAARSVIYKDTDFTIPSLATQSHILHTGQIFSQSVHLFAEQISLADQALIDVSGNYGGGAVFIGGGFQGKNPNFPNSRNISISPKARILADCHLNGDGGRVILWADEINDFAGTISARGGSESGNGGFVEVSSPKLLSYRGTSDLRSTKGSYGTLLLDPTNVSINTNPTTVGVVIANPSTIPPVATVDINNVDLVNQLNLSSVIISTAGAGPSLGDIDVIADIGTVPAWTANTSLSLIANRNLTVNANITADGSFAGDQLLFIADSNNVGSGDCVITTPALGGVFITLADGAAHLEGNNILFYSDQSRIQLDALGANGATRLIATNDITLLTSPVTNTANIRIRTTSSFESYAGRDILLQTGAGGNNEIDLTTLSGPHIYQAGRNLSLIGCIAPSFIGPNSFILLNSATDITLSAGENIIGTPNNIIQDGGSSGQLAIMLSNVNDNSTTKLYALGSVLLTNGDHYDNGVFFSNTFIFGSPATYGNVDLRAGADLTLGTSIDRVGASFPNPNTNPNNTIYIHADYLFSPGEVWAASPYPRLAGTPLGSASPIVSTATGKIGGDGFGAFLIPNAYFQESSNTLSGIDLFTIDGDITIKSANRFDNGSIANYLVANRLTLINGLYPSNIQSSTGDITIDPFQNITIANVMATAGNVLVIAQNNIDFTATGGINSGGTVTLVVDNAFPASPLIGPGAFNMAAGSFITSGGLLSIYTARQQQNSVFGILNGVAFAPGTLYVDTALEMWCLYYPTPLPGTPYTISYKDCLGLAVQQAAVIVDEFLVDLHPYNEFPGWMSRFWIDCVPKLDEQDFVFCAPEAYMIRRRNLSVINHPKSWTVLLQDTHPKPK